MEKWRPDWLDESAYDFLSCASWNTWAWQFLRRNGEYQKDWKLIVTDCNRLGVGTSLTSLSRKIGEKWFLTEMIDPSADRADGRWLISGFARRLTKAPKTNSEYLDLKKPEKQGYGFDLTKPISAQVKAVKADLLALQKSLQDDGVIEVQNPGKKIGELTLYLRILDARANLTSHLDITNTLESYKSLEEDDSGIASTPSDKKLQAAGSDIALARLNQNLKAANRLVKGGYQNLLLRLPKE